MKPRRLSLLLLPALLLTSADALAWGLYTHVYFAQLLLWAIPLADPALARLVRRYPRQVMAGACLPDLALTAPGAGAPRMEDSHRWASLHALQQEAKSDLEHALVLGYASHLMADIIAHNHFVPAHECLWFDAPAEGPVRPLGPEAAIRIRGWDLITHVVVEWAMDRHVGHQLFATPAQVLADDRPQVLDLLGRSFAESPDKLHRALDTLTRAETCLRMARLPNMLYHLARRLDRPMERRFNHYLHHTAHRLGQIGRLLDGELPRWAAEVEPRSARRRVVQFPRRLLKARLPLPEDLFHPRRC